MLAVCHHINLLSNDWFSGAGPRVRCESRTAPEGLEPKGSKRGKVQERSPSSCCSLRDARETTYVVADWCADDVPEGLVLVNAPGEEDDVCKTVSAKVRRSSLENEEKRGRQGRPTGVMFVTSPKTAWGKEEEGAGVVSKMEDDFPGYKALAGPIEADNVIKWSLRLGREAAARREEESAAEAFMASAGAPPAR